MDACDEGYRFFYDGRFLRSPEKGAGASNSCLPEKKRPDKRYHRF